MKNRVINAHTGADAKLDALLDRAAEEGKTWPSTEAPRGALAAAVRKARNEPE